MKKILLIIICSFCLQLGVKAQQKKFIEDTGMRSVIKDVVKDWQNFLLINGYPAYYNVSKINCFSVTGDTLILDSLNTVINSYDQLFTGSGTTHPTLNINARNRGIKSMDALKYLYFPFHNVDLSNNLIDSAGFRTLNWSFYDFNNLNLSNNLLSGNVNQYISDGIFKMYLDSNHLTSFNAVLQNSFPPYSLVFLSLKNNQITTLALQNIGTLYDIDFSYNNISSASFGDYQGNGFTYGGPRFNLSHNLLTHIPIMSPNYWSGGSSYTYLNLSYNSITGLDTNAIQIDPSSPMGGVYPNIFIDSLDLSHNNINIKSSSALLSFTKQASRFISNINLSSNNINVSPELYEGVTNYNCSNNNIYCLPKLPSTLQQLVIDTNKITCLPNAGNFTLNGHSNASFSVCNPTNNANGCKGFPTFTGTVFLDKNNNGIKGAGENAIQNIPIHLTNGITVYSDNNGRFSVSATDTGNHTIRIIAPKYHTAFPDSITTSFNRYDTTVDVGNIPVQLTTVFDSLTISTTPYNGAARSGFSYPISLFYKNVGSTTLSPTITLNYNNSKLIYNSCSNASAVNNGNSVSFTINNLDADAFGNATVYFTVNPNDVIGDTIATYTIVTANAVVAHDNTFTRVTGSYDPNEKDATPELSTTQLINGEYIDYTIHFQNTGNDTAFTVVVADTLSSKLQANSLQVVTSSHNCKTTLKDNKVYFEFRDILLPDSNVNLLGSNGFVRFRVKPINSLVVGDSINNKSSIYFDYNKPVLTNTATTKIVVPVIVPLKFTNYELRFTNERQVENHWITADEVNVSHFNVQRSLNGNDFVTIHKEQAKNRSYNEYSFIDNNPLSTVDSRTSKYYYRIVSVDKDGRTNYSEVRTINLQHQTSNITIFPNPAKDAVTINSKGVKHVTITDCFGRIVYKAEVNRASYILNLKSFAKGIYIFSFDNGEMVKVVKE